MVIDGGIGLAQSLRDFAIKVAEGGLQFVARDSAGERGDRLLAEGQEVFAEYHRFCKCADGCGVSESDGHAGLQDITQLVERTGAAEEELPVEP